MLVAATNFKRLICAACRTCLTGNLLLTSSTPYATSTSSWPMKRGTHTPFACSGPRPWQGIGFVALSKLRDTDVPFLGREALAAQREVETAHACQ